MILGIESSCDESAIAVVNRNGRIKGEWVHSQITKHAEYGGVVPDLAVGEHLQNFFPLLDVIRTEVPIPDGLDSIAVTCGPGLAGCLGVGITLAKTLSLCWDIPVRGVNHLRGHAYSPFMQLDNLNECEKSDFFPHLGLLVSGGNTLLFEIHEDLSISLLAKTVDDAVGECLDKGAKLLGMAYPGAPELEKYAMSGDPKAFDFPRFLSKKNDLRFSFSGLKTSLLYRLKKMSDSEVANRFADLCSSYQEAAFDQLVKTTEKVMTGQRYRSLGLSGGVANNQKIRDDLAKICQKREVLFLPAQRKHTGDNASMIAYAALLDPKGVWANDSQQLTFNPNLKITDLPN